MEKIKINSDYYEIESIRPISANVLEIIFTDNIPTTWEDNITIYTRDGKEATVLQGYNTVYQINGKSVYLSNNGSIYEEPEVLEPESDILPEEYIPTIDEVIEAKKAEINAACAKNIIEGITVTLSDGKVHHFELKEEDQIAMLLCANKVANGVENIPWHPNGDKTLPCVFYSNADMAIITQAAEFHISYHQTYCNSLKVWIESCQTIEETDNIFYGSDVPELYRSDVFNAYLKQIAEMTGEGKNDQSTE